MMKNFSSRYTYFFLLGLFALSFTTKVSAQLCNNRVVAGYLPDYRDPNTVDFTKLTHAYFAFLTATTTGGITAQQSAQITTMNSFLTNANAAGTKKLVTVGSSNMSGMTANVTRTRLFADSLRKYCQHHGFDGADIDWEGISNATDSTRYASLVKVLHDTLTKYNLELVLTIGFGDYWMQWVSNTTVKRASFIQIMVYDQTGTWAQSPFGNPSTFQHFLDAETYWVNRGITRDFIVMGLPFYGYQFASTAGGNATPYTYEAILERFPDMDSCSNETACNDYTFFDGPNLIRKKVNYAIAQGFKGVFIWEMGQDASTWEKSLHRRVWEEYQRACAGLSYDDICTTDQEPCVATSTTDAQSTEQTVWCETNVGILHFAADIISQGSYHLTVTDEMGRVVYSDNNLQQPTLTLPGNLPNAVYVVYLTNDKQKYTSKVLITR
ncbi:MAG: hypothetical protein JWO58_695 [Chitinophagaceae bacterium]|nr:hypothetical protein [Chitinophagaceae bacterium]